MTTNETGPRPIGSLVPAMPPSPGSPSRLQKPSEQTQLNRRLISERIAALLNHYWTPADTPEARSRIAADWITDLEEFSAAIVADAVQQWRRSESKRPTPADIRKICLDSRPAQTEPMPRHDHEAGARRARVHQQRYDDAAAWRQKFAEERGFTDFAAVIDYGIVAANRLPVKSELSAAEEIL